METDTELTEMLDKLTDNDVKRAIINILRN